MKRHSAILRSLCDQRPAARSPSGGPKAETLEQRKLLSAGDLDPTFADGGVLTPELPHGVYSGGSCLAIQSDGKIVVGERIAADATLARYNLDGSLDASFGSGDGQAVIGLGAILSVVVEPDGKIVVGGYTSDRAGNSVFGVVRCNSDGSVDPTFGEYGMIRTDMAGGSAMAVRSDGRIVLAGSRHGSIAVVRLNSDGSPDSTFGDAVSPAGDVFPSAVAIREDGKILVAGTLVKPVNSGGNDFLLVRYNADGTLDSSFGYGCGQVTTAFGYFTDDFAVDLAIQDDGKIVLAGDTTTDAAGYFAHALALVRYNSDGSLDGTFGDGDAWVVTRFGRSDDHANAMAIQRDGRIVVVGCAELLDDPSRKTSILDRYNTDGTLDQTFGSGGRVTAPSLSGEVGRDLAIQGDGKIVTVGEAQRNAGREFYVCRYLTGPTAYADAYSATQDQTLHVSGPGVLANDSGIAGMSALLLHGPEHGSLLLNTDGSFAYTPNLGYSGPDAFTYRATDGTADSDPATVSLSVAPAAPRSIYFRGDDLVINGSERADAITVSRQGDVLWVVVSTLAGETAQATVSLPQRRIVVYARGGDDMVVIDPAIGVPALVDSGSGNDTVLGGAGQDTLLGGDGYDYLHGCQGNDLLCGGPGNDTLWGEAGDDQLHGGQGDDILYGNKGRDTLWGDKGSNYLDAGQGNDTLYARNAQLDSVIGGAGTDAAQTDPLLDLTPFNDLETLLA